MRFSINLLLLFLMIIRRTTLMAQEDSEPTWKQPASLASIKADIDSLEYIGTFQYGISALAGEVIGTSYQVPSGYNHFKLGGDLGLYFIYPFSRRFYLYLWAGAAEKGYIIGYTRNSQNTINYRTDVATGSRNILYLEKVKCFGINLSRSFSIYLGAATSIKVKEKTKFDVTSYLTPINPATPSDTGRYVYYHYNQDGNGALDFIDVSVVGGIRWNAFNILNLSFRYMRDVVGLNTSTSAILKNTLVNSGYYLALEIPLYKNRMYKKIW